MNYNIVSFNNIKIAGISVRTNNKNGKSQKDIMELWKEWFDDEVGSMITNRVSDNIYCVYTEYDSDHSGDYTVILGYEVSKFDGLLDELVKIDIKPCSYREFISNGKVPDVVADVWNNIWNSESIGRSYATDFDLYIGDNMENMEVRTYISMKEK